MRVNNPPANYNLQIIVGDKPNIRGSMCASVTQPQKCEICKKSFYNKTSSEKYDILYYEI